VGARSHRLRAPTVPTPAQSHLLRKAEDDEEVPRVRDDRMAGQRDLLRRLAAGRPVGCRGRRGVDPQPAPRLRAGHQRRRHRRAVRRRPQRGGDRRGAAPHQKAPEHPFPIPLDDCSAAFAWTLDHAPELDIDPSRVGVAGDSAGGNLAAAVCLRARGAGGPAPAVQLSIYSSVDPALETSSAREYAEGYGLSTADMRWSWEQYVPDPRDRSDPLVVPLRAEHLGGLPPAIVVTAEFDILRDEGQAYADRLEAAGVPVFRHHYDGTVHGFFSMGGAVDECAQMLLDVVGDLGSLGRPAR
jgi:acetyl esterase/lipase